MRRNVIAAVLQLVGAVVVVVAAWAVSWQVGAMVSGAVVALVGLAVEGEG